MTRPAAIETCVECAGRGWLLDQAYGVAFIPPGWTPVQACDQCGRYLDADAAYAAADHHGTIAGYFAARDEPGDWAICWEAT